MTNLKGMSKDDFAPLIERIRGRISTWTNRFLSFAGRLQLIKSVLMSIINFWSTAYCLPGACLKEIESLCSAFLWSGPELNTTKSKISWEVICQPREAGGLGLRRLKGTNSVNGLKLIWQLLTSNSLWSQWIHQNTLKKHTFWDIAQTSSLGSWMWKKTLKLRNVAKSFYKKRVRNGDGTLFWQESWSDLGILSETLGPGRCIDLGIRSNSTVGEVLRTHRRRRHRNDALNEVENLIDSCRESTRLEENDMSLWKRATGFKPKFSARETWKQLQGVQATLSWTRAVWFTNATPKFAFITWLAMHDRLSTCDRMSKWSGSLDSDCCLCRDEMESRNHLFFECSYTSQLWHSLTNGLLQQTFSTNWNENLQLLSRNYIDTSTTFMARYALQTAVHAIWTEQNRRRHGDAATPIIQLSRRVDKGIRNRLSLLRNSGDQRFENILIRWFDTRL